MRSTSTALLCFLFKALFSRKLDLVATFSEDGVLPLVGCPLASGPGNFIATLRGAERLYSRATQPRQGPESPRAWGIYLAFYRDIY